MRAPSCRIPAASLVVLLGVAVLGTPPAGAADTRDCVTKKEYQAVEDGWRMKRVHHRFDTNGELYYYFEGSDTYPEHMERSYQRCSGLAPVHIDYQRPDGPWQVVYKSSW